MAHPVNEINNNNEMMEQFRRLNQIRIQIEFACLSFSVSALLVKKQTFFLCTFISVCYTSSFSKLNLFSFFFCSFFFLLLFCHVRVYHHRMHSHKYIYIYVRKKNKHLVSIDYVNEAKHIYY